MEEEITCSICGEICNDKTDVPNYWFNHFEGEEFQRVICTCGNCMHNKVLNGRTYANVLRDNAGAVSPQYPLNTHITTDETVYPGILGFDVTVTTRTEVTTLVSMVARDTIPPDNWIFVSDSGVIDRTLALVVASGEKNETDCD